ncbi:MAG: hypothetical protein QXH64_05030, partial [Nitrososphaeria archaeon]
MVKGVEALSVHDAKYFLNAASKSTTLLNTFRLLGTYLLYESYLGNYYYTWIQQFSLSKFLISFSVIVPAFIFMPLVFLKKLDREKRFMVVFLAISSSCVIFLMKGSAAPFGEINEFLLYIQPVFFRHPYER